MFFAGFGSFLPFFASKNLTTKESKEGAESQLVGALCVTSLTEELKMYINSNAMSLTAQRALYSAQQDQAVAMERLSTGKRINGAADDAAGLAIAQGFESQVRGLNQAVNNASQASQLAATTEGALNEVSEILQRIRELTVQAANDTLSTSDRTSITSEITSLTSEIDMIAQDTNYNGITVLDGTANNLSFQIGSAADAKVSVSIDGASASALGLSAGGGQTSSDGITFGNISETVSLATLEVDDILINGFNAFANPTTTDLTFDNETVSLDRNGVAVTEAMDITAAATAKAQHLAIAINANTFQHGVEASAITILDGATAGGVTDGSFTVTVDGEASVIRATSSMDDLVTAINQSSTAVASLNENGGLRLVDTEGRRITTTNSTLLTTGLGNVSVDGALTLKSVDGTGFTIESGKTSNDSGADETFAFAATGLMKGTYGTVSDPNSYELVSNYVAIDDADGIITALNDLTINGVQVGSTDPDIVQANLSANTYKDAINAVSAETGVTATASNEVFLEFTRDAATGTALDNDQSTTDSLTINGMVITDSANTSIADFATEINTAMALAESDIRAEVMGSADAMIIRLSSASGANIAISDQATLLQDAYRGDGDKATSEASYSTDYASSTNVHTFAGRLSLTSDNGPITLGVEDASTTVKVEAAQDIAAVLGLHVAGGYASSSSSGGSGFSVSSATAASGSLSTIDAAMAKVNTMRSDLGSLQNRLSHTIANLQTTAENHEASRSLIEDADYAVESATLARSQVLAQASSAMLAQANAAPQLALQLIQ